MRVYYKRITSTQFSELFFCVLFIKNNQPEILLMPKRPIWGGKFCSSLVEGRHEKAWAETIGKRIYMKSPITVIKVSDFR